MKKLILHIEIDGFNAEGLDEGAHLYAKEGPDYDLAEGRLEVVGEWMRQEVGITLVSRPGEKCMNDDFEIHCSYLGLIVGAQEGSESS